MPPHFQKTQYDTFSAAYDGVNDLPISRIIIPNVERLVGPYIKGARVLELACGSGFFTRRLLDWGAARIVGVDISGEMIKSAEREVQRCEDVEGKCQFMLADCSAPFTVTDSSGGSLEGKFDLVFAAWLLNYAPDVSTMTEMFKNISKHLRPGGRFVSVLPHPDVDPWMCIDHVNAQHEVGYGYWIKVLAPLPNGGYAVHLYFDTIQPPVDFGNYFLPMMVHEQAARDGGMNGTLKWEDVQVPEDQETLNRYMKEPVPKGYFDEWLKYPDFGLLVVEKQS